MDGEKAKQIELIHYPLQYKSFLWMLMIIRANDNDKVGWPEVVNRADAGDQTMGGDVSGRIGGRLKVIP